jgi:hypothetical protein
VGTAGLNNVINMIPAKDPQEFALFPAEDLAFVKQWMAWTDENVGLLQQTKVMPTLPQPSAGKLDGVVMVVNNNGAMFLYNPTARELPFSTLLDASLGFDCSTALPLIVKQMANSDRNSSPYLVKVVECGHAFNMTVPATTAIAIGFEEWGCVSAVPQVYGIITTGVAKVDTNTATLSISGARGPAGSDADIFVAMPPGTPLIKVQGFFSFAIFCLSYPGCGTEVVGDEPHLVVHP